MLLKVFKWGPFKQTNESQVLLLQWEFIYFWQRSTDQQDIMPEDARKNESIEEDEAGQKQKNTRHIV